MLISLPRRGRAKCMFLGYSAKTKGYQFYNPINKQLIISHDFDEKKYLEFESSKYSKCTFVRCQVDSDSFTEIPKGDNSYPFAIPITYSSTFSSLVTLVTLLRKMRFFKDTSERSQFTKYIPSHITFKKL